MSTNDSFYPKRLSTATISSQLPRPILPMPSESSSTTATAVHHAHHLDQLPSISTVTSKKGSAVAARQHSGSTSSSIMSFVSTSSEIGSPTVGPTPAGSSTPAPTNKRGRKPGPLSKTAREAQRRLNHSIIEKARRTKINDALATLKRLVPIDYLQTREMHKPASDQNESNKPQDEGEDEDVDNDNDNDDEEEEEEGADEEGPEDDSEYRDRKNKQNSSKTNVRTTSKTGKKQEKEKEFKLEILVRTVVFLQDVLERVGQLEASAASKTPQQCTSCGNTPLSPDHRQYKKRKRDFTSPMEPHEPTDDIRTRSKIARTIHPDPESIPLLTPRISPHREKTKAHVTDKRLPSISSWLNTSDTSHHLPGPPSFGTFVGTVGGKELASTSNSPSYLPSPPSSTHFDPVRSYTSNQVPFLTLGPGATTATPSSTLPVGMATASIPRRRPSSAASSTAPPTPLVLTPEDQSAASMLLQIASSPQFRPINPPASTSSSSLPISSASSNRSRSTTTSPTFSGLLNHTLSEPPHFSLLSTPSPNLHPPNPRKEDSSRCLQVDDRYRQVVETPSSILGIRKY